MSRPQLFVNSSSIPPSIHGKSIEASDPCKRFQEQTSYLRSMCHPWSQGTSSVSSSSSNVLVPVRTSSHRHSTLRKAGRRLEFCNFPSLFGSPNKQSENRDTKNRDLQGAGCCNKVKVRDEDVKEDARDRSSAHTRGLREGLQQLHVRSNALSLGLHPLKRKRRVSLRSGRPVTGKHSALEMLQSQSGGFDEVSMMTTSELFDNICSRQER